MSDQSIDQGPAVSLLKTRSVLEYHREFPETSRVQFVQWSDEDHPTLPGATLVEKVVLFPTEVWVDLGKPDKVTVSIEPGDTLNNGDTLNG